MGYGVRRSEEALFEGVCASRVKPRVAEGIPMARREMFHQRERERDIQTDERLTDRQTDRQRQRQRDRE